jgi:hypothetical protein
VHFGSWQLTTGGLKTAQTGILSTVSKDDSDDINRINRKHFQLTNDTLLGHYRIIEKTDAGGMGEISR